MIPDKMLKELSKSSQSVLLDLFDVDITEFGGAVLRFCNTVNELGNPVVWRGNVYEPYPIEISGAEMTNEGASNRPKLAVSNVMGLVTGLAAEYEMLVGVKVTRRQVLSDFLDASNFQNGNPGADPTQEVVTYYIIGQMENLTRDSGVFELVLPVETDDAVIPARLIIANVCSWEYRGEGCGYDGAPVADEYDEPVDSLELDKCSCSLKACKLRWGKNAVLPFGGFPSVDRVG